MDDSAISHIGLSTAIKGTLRSEGKFHIDGYIEGDVHCSNLSIGPEGNVVGTIFAERVLVLGKFNGILHANEVVLKAGSRVEGKLLQRLLQVEPGAKFSGSVGAQMRPCLKY
jgi:cytoskeletal protein CcmA (bactofilin family)